MCIQALTPSLIALAVALALVACGGETVDVGSDQNNTANNTARNNAGNNGQNNGNNTANNTDNNGQTGNNAANNSQNSGNNTANNAGNSDENNVGNNGQNNGENNACTERDLWRDEDDDGFGNEEEPFEGDVCEEPTDGYVAQGGDCGPMDAWRNPDSEEICGDHLDDDCDGMDEPCPTTTPSSLDEPNWDCQSGDPPENVYAWALFEDGGEYFEPGGCFVIFEGLEDEFYVERVNLQPVDTDCDMDSRHGGCTCPSLNDWPSYDRRLYAFTLQGEPDNCPEISMVDHGGEEQQVSNHCRKYLYQLYYYDLPNSYLASSFEAVQRRVELFPEVEIACAEDSPHESLPFASLLTAEFQINDSFAKK